MFRSSPLSTRGQFAQFLNDRGLVGEAVEIGTHRADFAEHFLTVWKGEMLYCVDPWTSIPGYEPQEKLLWGNAASREHDYLEAKRRMTRLGFYSERCRLLRMTSSEAAEQITDGTLDFVFVDGDHREEMVYQDLYEWWCKLKFGGILAGHDFIQPGEEHSWAGEIQRALSRFVTDVRDKKRLSGLNDDLDVHLIVEENGLPWSYYMEKS